MLPKPNVIFLEEYIPAEEDTGSPPPEYVASLARAITRTDLGNLIHYKIGVFFPQGVTPEDLENGTQAKDRPTPTRTN